MQVQYNIRNASALKKRVASLKATKNITVQSSGNDSKEEKLFSVCNLAQTQIVLNKFGLSVHKPDTVSTIDTIQACDIPQVVADQAKEDLMAVKVLLEKSKNQLAQATGQYSSLRLAAVEAIVFNTGCADDEFDLQLSALNAKVEEHTADIARLEVIYADRLKIISKYDGYLQWLAEEERHDAIVRLNREEAERLRKEAALREEELIKKFLSRKEEREKLLSLNEQERKFFDTLDDCVAKFTMLSDQEISKVSVASLRRDINPPVPAPVPVPERASFMEATPLSAPELTRWQNASLAQYLGLGHWSNLRDKFAVQFGEEFIALHEQRLATWWRNQSCRPSEANRLIIEANKSRTLESVLSAVASVSPTVVKQELSKCTVLRKRLRRSYRPLQKRLRVVEGAVSVHKSKLSKLETSQQAQFSALSATVFQKLQSTEASITTKLLSTDYKIVSEKLNDQNHCYEQVLKDNALLRQELAQANATAAAASSIAKKAWADLASLTQLFTDFQADIQQRLTWKGI